MTRSIRHTALFVFLLFGMLFANLNWLQVIRADDLSSDQRNGRQLVAEYSVRRGSITVGEGAGQREVAVSVENDGRLEFLRSYPEGPLYAHITGFQSPRFGSSQIEARYEDFLLGSTPEALLRNITLALRGGSRQGDTVVSTIEPAVQQAAAGALGEQPGAVVALDPRTGEVLAMVSAPTYDPNVLAGDDNEAVLAAWEQLEADPRNPRLNRATSELYAPGSTFKVITAAASLENGGSPDDVYDDPAALQLPQTEAQINNFNAGSTCNGGQITLRQALAVSCNTTFGQIGLDLGPEVLISTAEAFGLNADLPFDIPTATSRIPKELDAPQTAQSAIGQRDVRVSPLQMAMVAGAIANDGRMMQPRLVAEVEDFAGRTLRTYPAMPLDLPGRDGAQVVSPATAAALADMMTAVVNGGTASNAAISGVTVAGKTGTAEQGEGQNPDVWFIGFAPVEDPRVAVAVLLEDGGTAGSDGTGGRIAAPIARTVMSAALGIAQ